MRATERIAAELPDPRNLRRANEPWEAEIITNPVKVVNGYIDIPDRPGLGVDLNIEEIAKHPYQPEYYLPLFKPGWERRRSVPH
jgi:galactonate dehydratase